MICQAFYCHISCYVDTAKLEDQCLDFDVPYIFINTNDVQTNHYYHRVSLKSKLGGSLIYRILILDMLISELTD